MLDTGIYPLGRDDCLKAQYIEVFAPNVNAFPEATERAHEELTAPHDRECYSTFSCQECDESCEFSP